MSERELRPGDTLIFHRGGKEHLATITHERTKLHFDLVYTLEGKQVPVELVPLSRSKLDGTCSLPSEKTH